MTHFPVHVHGTAGDSEKSFPLPDLYQLSLKLQDARLATPLHHNPLIAVDHATKPPPPAGLSGISDRKRVTVGVPCRPASPDTPVLAATCHGTLRHHRLPRLLQTLHGPDCEDSLESGPAYPWLDPPAELLQPLPVVTPPARPSPDDPTVLSLDAMEVRLHIQLSTPTPRASVEVSPPCPPADSDAPLNPPPAAGPLVTPPAPAAPDALQPPPVVAPFAVPEPPPTRPVERHMAAPADLLGLDIDVPGPGDAPPAPPPDPGPRSLSHGPAQALDAAPAELPSAAADPDAADPPAGPPVADAGPAPLRLASAPGVAGPPLDAAPTPPDPPSDPPALHITGPRTQPKKARRLHAFTALEVDGPQPLNVPRDGGALGPGVQRPLSSGLFHGPPARRRPPASSG